MPSDFNIGYSRNGLVKESSGNHDIGDQIGLDWTIAYQFGIGSDAEMVLTPLLEVSYIAVARDQIDDVDKLNTGESVSIYITRYKIY